MEKPEQTLGRYRAQIDAIDEQLSTLLIERIGIIGQVATLKRANWPKDCHIRPGREGQMHRAITDRFKNTAFPPLAALAIWRQLIGASTHLESPLNVVAIDPTHGWMAREYFGVQIGLHMADTFGEAQESIRSGRSNILILPHPTQSDWWKQAGTYHDASLRIFAMLPAAHPTLPPGVLPAVALAHVTTEPSGSDVSYFLHNAKLEIRDGFVTELHDAIYLGTHPRAIHLE